MLQTAMLQTAMLQTAMLQTAMLQTAMLQTAMLQTAISLAPAAGLAAGAAGWAEESPHLEPSSPALLALS
jgi:hypothetical protein